MENSLIGSQKVCDFLGIWDTPHFALISYQGYHGAGGCVILHRDVYNVLVM